MYFFHEIAINPFQRSFLFVDSQIQILLIFTLPNILTDIHQKRNGKPLASGTILRLLRIARFPSKIMFVALTYGVMLI